jgi:hypothetical protein
MNSLRPLLLLAALLLAGVVTRAAAPVARPFSLAVTTVTSETGLGLQVIDLADNNVGVGANRLATLTSLEFEVRTGGTAPGTSRTVTAYYAFASIGTYTAAEMSTAAASQSLALVNSANTTRVYTLPVVYLGARYLYVWFDHSALDASASFTLIGRVNGLAQ